MKTFQDYGIDTRGKTSGEIKTTCPECSPTRKKKNDPCLAVNLDKQTWYCHHCEWSGGFKNGNGYKRNGQRMMPKSKAINKPKYSKEDGLSEKARNWFHERGITDEVLERNQITDGSERFEGRLWSNSFQGSITRPLIPFRKTKALASPRTPSTVKSFSSGKMNEKCSSNQPRPSSISADFIRSVGPGRNGFLIRFSSNFAACLSNG